MKKVFLIFFKGMMKIVREHIQTAPPKYDQIQRPINKSCHTICCTVIHSSGLQNWSIILIHHSRPRYGHNVMKLYTIESEGNHFHWTQNKQRLFDHGPKASLHSLPKTGGGGRVTNISPEDSPAILFKNSYFWSCGVQNLKQTTTSLLTVKTHHL